MSISLKTEALAWLRYSKRMFLSCTECGPFSADAIGLDETKSIEVECKVSRSDFLRDFKDKARKHEIYANLKKNGKAVWSPNYFYFLVPLELKESCLKTLDEMKIDYAGLATLDRETKVKYWAGKYISVVRKAPKLHNNKPSAKLIRAVQMRMSSEIVGLRLSLEMLKNAKPEEVGAIVREVGVLANVTANNFDWEEQLEEITTIQN